MCLVVYILGIDNAKEQESLARKEIYPEGPNVPDSTFTVTGKMTFAECLFHGRTFGWCFCEGPPLTLPAGCKACISIFTFYK